MLLPQSWHPLTLCTSLGTMGTIMALNIRHIQPQSLTVLEAGVSFAIERNEKGGEGPGTNQDCQTCLQCEWEVTRMTSTGVT